MATVVAMVADGMSHDEILAAHPELESARKAIFSSPATPRWDDEHSEAPRSET